MALFAQSREVQARQNSERSKNQTWSCKPPSDDPAVNETRKRLRVNSARSRENQRLKQEGREPLVPILRGPKSVTTGNAATDKKREGRRLSQRRGLTNSQRAKDGLPPVKGPYSREEIDFYGDIKHY